MEYALVNILMAADDKINRDLLNSTLANMTTAPTSTGSKTKVRKDFDTNNKRPVTYHCSHWRGQRVYSLHGALKVSSWEEGDE